MATAGSAEMKQYLDSMAITSEINDVFAKLVSDINVSNGCLSFALEWMKTTIKLEETAQSFTEWAKNQRGGIEWSVKRYEPHFNCVVLEPTTKSRDESIELRSVIGAAISTWGRPHENIRHEIEYPKLPVGF